MWQTAIITCTDTGENYRYHAKVYDEPSETYGLNGSRVSKLEIRRLSDNKCVFNFDRGDDVPAANAEVETVLNIILTKYATGGYQL
jgi:hypothetical protein